VFAKHQNDRAERDAGCTNRSCPTFDVAKYLQQLRQALPYVPPIPVNALTSLHAAQDYQGMVELIKKTMNVEGRLIVGWVNSGGPKEMADAPAWIGMPEHMPFYGTQAFRETTITMYVRKSKLAQYTYDQFAILVAHELSHIVLSSIQHPLRRCEKAVDLTAMLLGFRLLYASGAYKEWHSQNRVDVQTLGYLRPEEVQIANEILTPERPKTALSLTRTKVMLLVCVVIGAITLIGMKEFYGAWQLHQTLVLQRIERMKQVPWRIDASTTLIDIRVGFKSWTEVYETRVPKNRIDIPAFEREIRSSLCSSNVRTMISDGVSYNYEYRDPSKAPITRIEISSCP
jgi:hypothetical protein